MMRNIVPSGDTLAEMLDYSRVDYAVFDPRTDTDEINALHSDVRWELEDAADDYVLFRRAACVSGLPRLGGRQ